MKQKINLSIKKPCTESFDSFQSTSTGGFCDSCQKAVIDFTKMSDGQILDYFKKNKENTCGRFEKNQLKSYSTLSSPSKRKSFNLLGASLIGASLLTALPNQKTQAQQHNPTEKVEEKDTKKEDGKDKKESDPITITGVVKDDYGDLLPGATVIVKGTTNGISTDFDGKFSLRNVHVGDVLIYSFIGLKSKEVVVLEKHTFMEIVLDSYELLGEVSVSEVYSSKKSLWQRIKSIFR
jgi:hypothetical protein